MPTRLIKNPGSRGGPSPEERRIREIARSRVRRENNRELLRGKQREYRRKNADSCAERNKAWAAANPEKMLEYHRKSRKNNPDGYNTITRRYRQTHPEKQLQFNQTNRARRRGAPGNLSDIEWSFIVACFSGHCGKCGLTERLSVDHIVPVSKSGHHSLDNVQPLCVPCNSSKHIKTIDYRLSSTWFNREMYEQGV